MNQPIPKRTISAALTEVRRLTTYFRPYKWRVLVAAIALLIAAGTMLGLGQGLRWMVDSGLAGGNSEMLDQSLLVLLAVVILLSGATAVRYYSVTWIGERIAADLRKSVFDHLITLEPGFFEEQHTGELLSRLTADTTVLQSVIGTSVSIALRNLLILIGGTVLLAITSPKLTGLVSLCVPLVIVPIVVFGRRVRRLARATQDRVGDVGAYADEAFHGIRTLQAFGHEEHDRQLFGTQVDRSFLAALSRIRTRAQLTAVIIFLVFTAIGIILWVGGHDMLAGRITAGELSAFVFYSVMVAAAVGALAEVIGELQQAAGATERLLELLGTTPKIENPATPITLPEPPRGEVVFDDVCFAYPTRPDQPALDHFSLQVEPGQTIALVGPSGAGKSTVFNLLLRFNDPQQGSVSIDGVDLREADIGQFRSRIALVSQEPTLFAESIFENIRYGRPDADDQAVYAAARAAHAEEFIQRLPDGYATQLGERGARLSGGQKQRIAIARALLRDPALLLLDEATSALDAESEQAVQEALKILMQGRTTLVIAHRLATIVSAQRIIVMEQGRIVSQGTHGELTKMGGLYSRLAELQFDSRLPVAEPVVK
ncbi:MAG: ABC transporter transmembrane domain-containing protein [Immundisolibacteraceae bacterium]|nr:ABC transporter transmembrane domain-containing protein [Immundisolibacteraceae bacterium]